METSELLLPALVLCLIIGMLALGLYKRVIAKLGLRNFFRHKGHSAISIMGLLVGTSIICASMVVGDSIEYFIVEDTYNDLDLIDVVVVGESNAPFDESIFTLLDNDPAVDGLTDGMAPLFARTVSLRHTGTGQFEPTVNIIGFDAAEDADFGNFVLADDDSTEVSDEDLGANDSIINLVLARSLGAEEGDDILLTYTLGGGYMGPGEIHSRTFTIKYIVDDVGKARFNPGNVMAMETFNLFVNIHTAQEMFQQPGMLTHIKISNNGGVVDGVENSDAVTAAIEPLLAGLTFSSSDVLTPYPMNNQTMASLAHHFIIEDSFSVEVNGTLLPASQYILDNETGVIVFLTPIQMGLPVTADYDFTYKLNVEMEKQDRLEMAQSINELLSTFLTIFGSFAILAGVILIINIFTMLAEERKSELGMARAVGMKRRHLMLSFLFEGLAYGSVASALGTLVGVMIGAFLIYMINNIASIMAGIVIPFHFENFSLIKAFSTGFFITFVTILLTSWKISKLNIIRAIRGIDEPEKDRKGWKMPVLGVLLTVLSTLVYFQLPDEFLVKLLAPSGIITGLALLLWRWIGDRVTVSSASLGVFLWTYFAISTYFGGSDMGEMEMPFILSGILIVLSLVLLIMYNSRPVIMAIVNTFGRVRSLRPTVMTAVSYPLSKKFRTGMSVAMFALVVYMIVMLSVFSGIFVIDLEEETLKQGGGFDIIAGVQHPTMDLVNAIDPLDNSVIISPSLEANVSSFTNILWTFSPNVNNTDGEDAPTMGFGGFGMFDGSQVLGIRDDFYVDRAFEFTQLLETIGTESNAWESVAEPGSDKVIVSGMVSMIMGIKVGDHITFDNLVGLTSQEFQVVGILDNSLMSLSGVFMSQDNLMTNFYFPMMPPDMMTNIFMFDVDPAYDVDATARALEKDYAAIGMNAILIHEVVEDTMEMMNSMFILFELYLYMGLVVGVAGLGIITIRSVVERTPEIGILRSIGFKRKNIRNAFLIEILFVATMGVLIGILTGIIVSHEIFIAMVGDMGGNIEYVIPWSKIAFVTAIAYIATILCTIIPAHNASKVAPAEALRYVG